MLSQLKSSVALFFLPSTVDVIKSFDKGVKALDARTVHIEATLENKAVALAHNSAKRRSVHDLIVSAAGQIMVAVYHVVDAVHASFDRKEKALIAEVGALRTHLEAASAARDAVAKVIAGL